MDIASYLAILRRRWMILAGAVLLGVIGAVTVSALTQPLYEASARLFVTTTAGSSVVEAYQGNLFIEERVATYAKLAAGKQVAQRTIDALHLNMRPEELMAMEHAAVVPNNSVLLGITVRNPNPEMARDLANTIAQQTTQLVEELETSPRGGGPAATTVLVDQADAPSSPVTPNWYRNVALGVLGGLLVGLVAAIVRDKSDHSVRSVEQAASAVDARALGSVPARPRRASGLPSSAAEPRVVDAFRAIRTNLYSTGNGHGQSSGPIVVAEPRGGRAATTVTLGLAAALAESGRSVCLIDGDLRNRRASQALGVGKRPGLSELLSGSPFPDEMLVNTELAHLKVLPAGQPQQLTPGELLSRGDMAELIKPLSAEFNVILIDGPPVLPTSDVVVMSAWTRGVLLVARAKSTRTVDLSTATTKIRMAGAEPLGVVVIDQKHPSDAGL